MATAATSGWQRVSAWVRSHVPTRDSVERNRFLRPVAHRILVPSLWRLNRRSVPRGVALGIFAGVLFPFAHMVIAAVLALPLRANVPTAVGTTLVNNPITFVPLMAGAYRVGRWMLHVDRSLPGHPVVQAAHSSWLHWIASGAGVTMVGLLGIAIVAAALGYAGAALGWRWWIVRKWRHRSRPVAA